MSVCFRFGSLIVHNAQTLSHDVSTGRTRTSRPQVNSIDAQGSRSLTGATRLRLYRLTACGILSGRCFLTITCSAGQKSRVDARHRRTSGAVWRLPPASMPTTIGVEACAAFASAIRATVKTGAASVVNTLHELHELCGGSGPKLRGIGRWQFCRRTAHTTFTRNLFACLPVSQYERSQPRDDAPQTGRGL